MQVAALYVSVLAVFLTCEGVWLTKVMRPLFERNVGALLAADVRWTAAVGFYLIYAAGIVHFAALPALRDGGPQAAAVNGALLGALVYGVYEATNMATLRGWTWSMVAADVAGGAVFTALAAAASVWLVRATGIGSA